MSALVAVVAIACTAHAEERHVPSQYTTIQAAVDACVDGDVVTLAPGTYTGDGNTGVYVPPLAITIRSLLGDPNTCTIDGEGLRTGFAFTGEDDHVASVDGLTFANCIEFGGGAALSIVVFNATQPRRSQVVRCRFRNNHSTHNSGGALYAIGAVEISECSFTDNSAGEWGGAARLGFYNQRPIMERCTITNNESPSGGGLLVGQRATVRHCTIEHNLANGSDGLGLGGGIITLGDDTCIASCVIANNEAERGGGVALSDTGSTTVDGGRIANCEIRDNVAHVMGGGLYVATEVEHPIHNCLIVGNHATYYGGGVSVTESDIELIGCNLSNNSCDFYGGGVYALGDYTFGFHNGILFNNTAAIGDDVAVDYLRVFRISHSCITNPLRFWFGGGAYVDWGSQVIDSDPAFRDPPQDYRLSFASPCVDMGSNDLIPPDRADVDEDGDLDEQVPWDLDASQRVMRGLVDLGPYEIPFGDLNCDKVLNNGDIDPFVLAITDPAAYGGEHPECVRGYADMNADGLVNNGDIDVFVALLGE